MAKPKWVSVNPISGQNDGSIEVTATENTIPVNRSGAIEVTGGGITKSIDVSQILGGFYLKEVASIGNTRPPCSVKSTRKVQELNAANGYRITMTETFGITIDMDYIGLATGSVAFRMVFSKSLTANEIGMVSGEALSSYINCRINPTDPTQLIFNLGNGYPEISNRDKVAITVSASSTENFIIYYANEAI